MNELISKHLDIWTRAIASKSSVGRGNKSPSPVGEGRGEGNTNNTRNTKYTAYGIKKLRELILELAVRKLVPQDSNDEPANILLNKIAKKKAFLMANGELKNQPKLAKISQEDLPFIVPKNWQWARLGDVTNYGITDKVEPNEVDDAIWVLELEDIEKETSRLLQKVRYAERNFQSSKNRFSENDVIYGKLRPYLDKVIIADEDGVCTTEIIPIRAFDCITPRYLKLVLKSPYFINYANDSTHGMNLPRLGTDRARLALFPLAPESEQHRIVAKVDELMLLCDQLEQQQTDSIAAHQTLVQTLLDTLTQAADAEEFEQALNRIADHFDTLFTTESSVDQLKQTLLQLAVMGKLVPQDRYNEKINFGLIRSNKAKKFALENDQNASSLHKIPSNWTWVSLGMVLSYKQGLQIGKGEQYIESGVDLVRYLRIIDFRHDDDVRFIKKSEQDVYCKPEDLIMIRYGGTAGEILSGKSGIFHNNMFRIDFDELLINRDFLKHYLAQQEIRILLFGNSTSSTMPQISHQTMNGIKFPLPPKEEQHRIVAKVDELMALRDALKARITAAQTTQIQLADAIVEQAIA